MTTSIIGREITLVKRTTSILGQKIKPSWKYKLFIPWENLVPPMVDPGWINEIDTWLTENNITECGLQYANTIAEMKKDRQRRLFDMEIVFKNEDERTMFLLRWGNELVQ